MKHILFPLFSIFFVFTTAQTSNIKIYSENQEPFSIKINGQKVSSIDDNSHDISGMKQGVDYEVFIDYTMPNTSDVRTSINIMKNDEKGTLSFMVPKFFQGSLIYKGVINQNGELSIDGNMSLNMDINSQGVNVSMGIQNHSNNNQVAINSSHTQNTNSSQSHTNNNSSSSQSIEVYVDGYNGKIGCAKPVNSERLALMMEDIENESFAEDKVRVAKRILKNNCITIDNLVLMLEEISFDEDQLNLAKFAYEYVYDLGNYYKVFRVFSFSKSKEDLEEYIENK